MNALENDSIFLNDGIIIKYSSNGEVEWATNVGGSSSDYIKSIVATADGGCIAGGYFYGTIQVGNIELTSNGGNDGLLIKYTPEGKVEWARNTGGTSSDYIYSLNKTTDGVILSPILFGTIFTLPFINTPQHEFDVPKSIPTTIFGDICF